MKLRLACPSPKIVEVWQVTRIDILRGMLMNAADVIVNGVAYSRLTRKEKYLNVVMNLIERKVSLLFFIIDARYKKEALYMIYTAGR